MSWVDELSDNIAGSQKLDDGTRQLLGSFVQDNRTMLEQLGPSLGDTFFRTLAGSGPDAAWDAVAQGLSPKQVADMLSAAQQEMTALANSGGVQTQGAKVLLDSLAQAALTVLVRALLVAL